MKKNVATIAVTAIAAFTAGLAFRDILKRQQNTGKHAAAR